MGILFVLFVVLLALAAVLSVLNHRDLPAHDRDSRGWWPGSHRSS
jgi:hypothetical protein